MAEPTLQQLRYAVAVAEQGHFGKAAAATYVSQPALSAQIKELEDRLGTQLFERTGRGVVVTAAGREVVDRARAILAAVDELCAVCSVGGGAPTGSIRIGVIPTVSPYVLPQCLAEVQRTWPDLRLHFRDDRTDGLVEHLLAGSIDVALLALPLGQAGVDEHPLYDEPLYVAVPDGHPLATGRPLVPADLDDQTFVLLEEGHCLRDHALQVCTRRAGGPLPEIQATSLAAVTQMVCTGHGITVLPATAAAVEVRPGNPIALRRFPDPAPTRTVGLAWRASSPGRQAFVALGAVIARVANEIVGHVDGRVPR